MDLLFALLGGLLVVAYFRWLASPLGSAPRYCECTGADGCSNDPRLCPIHGEDA
jgi:hypothetical protein